ncbi:leucine-rich repeat domain-containing protein [Flavobacterium sp. MDT1-60]|uniref:leucine-rich repeat domain-containing protein n=1 Tax=Flavobacterium sp. MDT1-60 TaxID=1979344 RepID=UPI0017839181|nr:hypothetical protein [Flavobacterium sp. MDT1-60]QOG04319.1 hypothetical protein IHE43_08970 [Flavobacterium sp. MDT1-60]
MITQKYIISKALALDTVNEGKNTDEILVYSADKEVKRIPQSSFSIEIKGVYNNNGEAKADGLVVGDYYRKPIVSDSESSVLAVVVDVLPTMKLVFNDIDTTASFLGITDKESIEDWNVFFSASTSLIFTKVRIEGNDAIFTRSDSFSGQINLNSCQIKDIDFTGFTNQISRIFLQSNEITFFNPTEKLPHSVTTLDLNNNTLATFDPHIELPDSLEYLSLSNCDLKTFNPSIALPVDLKTLNLEVNQIETFNPTIALPSGLNVLKLNVNEIVVFNPSLALPADLQELILNNNKIVTFDPSIALPSNLKYLNLNDNQIVTFDPANFALPANLDSFSIGDNKIATFDPANFALPNSITSLSLFNNQIVSFDLVNFLLPSNLKILSLGGNKISTFDPSVPLPDNLEFLSVLSCSIVSFNPTLPLPATLKNIRLEYNRITTSSWNTATAWISNLGNNGSINCEVNYDSIIETASETLLRDKGWTIITQ